MVKERPTIENVTCTVCKWLGQELMLQTNDRRYAGVVRETRRHMEAFHIETASEASG